MKFKFITLFIISIFTFSYSHAIPNRSEDKIKINISTPELNNESVYFAKYYNGEPYLIDSTNIYENGKYHFEIDQQPQGEYLVFIKPNIQLPLLLDTSEKIIDININDLSSNDMTVHGSKLTEMLWDFNRKAIPLVNRKNSLMNKLKSPKSIEQYKRTTEEIQIIRDSINMTIDKCSQEHKNPLLTTYLKSKKLIKRPYVTPLTNDERILNLNYIKDNYWNEVDLNQAFLWNGPTIYDGIQEYLYSIVSPEPDSIAYAASVIANRINQKDLREKYLTYMINKAGEKKYVGQENIWAKLAEDFIIDKDHAWIDSLQYQKLMQEYAVIKNNRIGNTAKNIKSLALDGNLVNTDSIDANYLILYFYSPSCGHCGTETPIVHNLMSKYKDDNVKVVAFNTTSKNKTVWQDFIEQNQMQDWINVGDPNNQSAYWLNYDVRGVPSIYVLDKDKRIVIKNIGVNDLEYILDLYLNKK